jgi:hypothetical protein
MASPRQQQAQQVPTGQTVVGVGQQYDNELPDPGMHRVVMAEVVDQGWKDGMWGRTHDGFLNFQLEQCYEGEGDLAGVRMEARIWFCYEKERRNRKTGDVQIVPVGLGSFAKGTELKRRLQEFTGVTFTAAMWAKMEKQGTDLNKLVGREGMALIAIKKAKTSEKQFAEIVQLFPPDPKQKAKKGYEPMEVENYTPIAERKARDGGANGSTSFNYGANAGDEAEAPAAADDSLPWDE